MKTLLVVVLMMVLPLAMAAQTQHFKFNQDAEFASLTQSTGPNSSFTLQVSRGANSISGASASILYISIDVAPDFSSESFVEIIGAIPSSSFTGQNTQHLTLDIDTSQLDPSNSFAIACDVDLITFDQVCGAPASGTIHLDFQQNGQQRTRVLALGEEIINGPVTTRIHQRSDNSSANAQGTVFGASVSSGNATVGINHNSSIEVVTTP
jgi:hypothetical protein